MTEIEQVDAGDHAVCWAVAMFAPDGGAGDEGAAALEERVAVAIAWMRISVGSCTPL
jgi:hypothetical protein